jgi:hypothetical protein
VDGLDPERLTIIGLLIVALVTGAREVWVFGWYYRQMRDDRDEWRDLARRGTGMAEKAVDVAQKKIA